MTRRRRILFFIPLFFLGILVFGGLIMWLWNTIAVPVLHVSVITFWQALGLLVLSKILFGGFGGGRGGNWSYRKQRMMWKNMTPEQKEKFKEEWKNCNRRWSSRRSEAENELETPGGEY